jgi:predicted DNA-binding ribbon-helix-helix protein
MKNKKEDIIKTSLYVSRILWRKIKVIAGNRNMRANDLVVETLAEKYASIEVTV